MAEISGNRSIAQQRRPPLSPSKTVCPIITDNSTPLKLSESGKDSISQATSILSKLHSQRPQPTGIQSCPSSASTPRAKGERSPQPVAAIFADHH